MLLSANNDMAKAMVEHTFEWCCIWSRVKLSEAFGTHGAITSNEIPMRIVF